MRSNRTILALVLAAHASVARGQTTSSPLTLLDVPFLSQSEALCGGAAAAMVMRYWGEREVSSESFSHLLDREASGVHTDALVADLERRGWTVSAVEGDDDLVLREIDRARPVIALIEDRPRRYHYVVVVGWHARGVVFHDPARTPYRVMSRAEFDRRWDATNRWMAVVVPSSSEPSRNPTGLAPLAVPDKPQGLVPQAHTSVSMSCEQLVGDGVRASQADDFDLAERTLVSALSCPGAARELAGVRLLQKRWDDVDALAASAVAADSSDAYAWKLLGAARFVRDDPRGALDAWNHAGEPRIDAVRLEGVTRTRYQVVDRMLGVGLGDILTDSRLRRAQRRLAELPAAASAHLDYAPVQSGLAELRASVVERRLLPTSRTSLAMMGASAVFAREVQAVFGPFTGGGERTIVAWRYWPHRPRIAAGIRAPAAWGGTWGLDAFHEAQAFAGPVRADAERTGMRLTQSHWMNPLIRWNVGVGLDRWKTAGAFGVATGGVRVASRRDRIDARVQLSTWRGHALFATGTASVLMRSSSEPRGFVVLAMGTTDLATSATPIDLWPGGDTGSVRSTLLRAHPVLDDGRLLVDRLGRRLQTATGEARRWWPVAGPLRVAAATFVDVGRTAERSRGGSRFDADAGIGARFSTTIFPGTLRIDLAHGLRDGANVLSFVLEP